MMPVELLLCYLLLQSVEAISHGNQTEAPRHFPSSLGSQSPSSGPLFCQDLLPKSLPGFTHMALLPRFLVGLALRNALEAAGCRLEARALQFRLYRQGGVKATQVLTRQLQGLQKGRSTGSRESTEALVAALQLWAWQQPGPGRARRSLTTARCASEQEQRVHKIVQLLPVVATYYNLGTALYYATQNCSDAAKERGQDGAIDLTYDLLMAMAGLSGGPTGLLLSSALKPAVKAGVQQLIQYYYEEEPSSSLSGPSKEGLVDTTDVSGLGRTTMASEGWVSAAPSPAPFWRWGLF
ncbi:apolipoprotein F [Dasypus novemcinctus]|uniref:apolipoprotein F n=1 Tax=Dasypus novemcinctus TaxID=9361 RepID=UPI00265DA093|nr:apolipoprotein F [Dasypus novemcinctus]